jgi:hypothetical protein
MAGAIIRANRAEVSDRFPMLGFTVRTGARPYFEAVVTTDPTLLDSGQRERRKPDTFWSSRELGPLPAERGEAVLIVPDAVLRRFAGSERLYYAVATFADRTRSNPEVTRLGADVTPYVTLSSQYTGRRIRQLIGGTGERTRWNGSSTRYVNGNGASLEWAGDAATPGVETANGGKASPGEGPAATDALAYSDGFDPGLWTEQPPSGPSSGVSDNAFDIGWADVPTVAETAGVPGWLAAAAMLIGWRDGPNADLIQILQRLGGLELPGGAPVKPEEIATLAQALDLVPEPPAAYTVESFRALLSSKGPQWIGVAGVRPRFVVATGLYGDDTPEGAHVRINDPSRQPLASPDAPFASGTGMGSSYVLTFKQFLDAFATLAPGAGLQAIHVTEASMKLRQPAVASAYALRKGGTSRVTRSVRAHAQAAPAVIPIAAAIVGATMTRVLNNEGDISWELDQMKGLKHPGDDPARATVANYRTIVTPVAGWPKVVGGIHEIEALSDEIYADFVMEWQCNGHSLGNVAIKNTHTNDAAGHGLEVKAIINDDSTVYEGDLAALRVSFNFRFTRSLGSDAIAIRDYTLYGDGTFAEDSRWTQRPDGWWGASEQRYAGAYEGGGAGAAVAGELVEPVITWVKESLEDDITTDLPKMEGWKHVNGDPSTARPPNRQVQKATIKAPFMEVSYPIPGVDDRPIRCDLIVLWGYDGSSVGNINVRPTNPNDPPGGGLSVRGELYDEPDQTTASGGKCAAVRLAFNYTFTFEFDSQGRKSFDVILYGDGRHAVELQD